MKGTVTERESSETDKSAFDWNGIAAQDQLQRGFTKRSLVTQFTIDEGSGDFVCLSRLFPSYY